MKKMIVLSAILALLGGCGKNEVNVSKTGTIPEINRVLSSKKYFVEGNFENESAYVIFTNTNALNRSSKERIVIKSNNSTTFNTQMNLDGEVEINKILDPFGIREKEVEALENLKKIEYTNPLFVKNESTQAENVENIEKVGDKKVFNVSIMDSNLIGVYKKSEFSLIKKVDLRN